MLPCVPSYALIFAHHRLFWEPTNMDRFAVVKLDLGLQRCPDLDWMGRNLGVE